MAAPPLPAIREIMLQTENQRPTAGLALALLVKRINPGFSRDGLYGFSAAAPGGDRYEPLNRHYFGKSQYVNTHNLRLEALTLEKAFQPPGA